MFILSIYLNRVYLGSGTYGVQAAAEKYFRGLSDGFGQSLAFSPQVGVGSEAISSFTLMMQVEGTGELECYNPANLTENCHATSPWVSVMTYRPNDGDLIVFPGWVPHDVGPNTSNKQRINIAFNISFNVQFMTDGQEDY